MPFVLFRLSILNISAERNALGSVVALVSAENIYQHHYQHYHRNDQQAYAAKLQLLCKGSFFFRAALLLFGLGLLFLSRLFLFGLLVFYPTLIVYIFREHRSIKLGSAGFAEYIAVRAFTAALFTDQHCHVLSIIDTFLYFTTPARFCQQRYCGDSISAGKRIMNVARILTFPPADDIIMIDCQVKCNKIREKIF